MKYALRIPFLVVTLILGLVNAPASTAAICPPTSVDGKTIGTISVGKVKVLVKNVDYPEGEALSPPKSPLNAGISIRHQPLSATSGSSIIVWHINYNGCQGKLNVINSKKKGFTFKVKDEAGKIQKYAVTSKYQVRKGNYKSEWFMLTGPRQLVMVTCIGKVVDGHYLDNLVVIATPVVDSENVQGA